MTKEERENYIYTYTGKSYKMTEKHLQTYLFVCVIWCGVCVVHMVCLKLVK